MSLINKATLLANLAAELRMQADERLNIRRYRKAPGNEAFIAQSQAIIERSKQRHAKLKAEIAVAEAAEKAAKGKR